METEQQLLNRMREGDDTARRDLYCRFAPQAMAVAVRYVANADDARDVLQDAFVKVLTSVARFGYRGEGSLRAWVMRIVANESLTWLKHRQRLTFADDLPDDVPDVEEPDVGDVPMAALQQMIAQLPPGYRAVFCLYVFEQLNHQDIALRLGIRASTSASQFLRAKRLLAQMINDYKRQQTT